MTEEWLPLPSSEERYLISDHGRVWSRVSGRLLTPQPNRKGRRQARLVIGGRAKTYYVAHLVAQTFIGPRPGGMQVLHDNDECGDDRASNLYYGTPVQNGLDAARNGRNHYANRDACKNKHPFTPENTYFSQGARRCRACKRASRQRAAA